MKSMLLGVMMIVLSSCGENGIDLESLVGSGSSCPSKVSNKDLTNFVDENWGQKFINYNSAASSVTGHVITSKCEVVFALDTGSGTYALTRYKSDMTLDTRFGSNGFVAGDIGIASGTLRGGINIDKNDNFFLGFEATLGATNKDFVVLKLKSSGTKDTSFGTEGLVSVDYSNSQDRIAGAIPLPSGKVLVHGQIGAHVGMIRLLSDGSIDTTYGTAGKQAVRPTGATNGTSYSQLVGSDGIYLIGLSAGGGSGYRCMVGKVDFNGEVITTWGTDGFVETDNNIGAGGEFDACYRAKLDSAGNLFVFGESESGGIIVKIDSSGALDNSFGGDGVVYNLIAGTGNYARSGYILSSGKILSISSATAWGSNIGITVLNTDGSLDTSFSPTLNDAAFTEQTPGQLILNVGANDLSYTSGVFEADGQIYLYFTTNANAFNEQVIYRLNI